MQRRKRILFPITWYRRLKTHRKLCSVEFDENGKCFKRFSIRCHKQTSDWKIFLSPNKFSTNCFPSYPLSQNVFAYGDRVGESNLRRLPSRSVRVGHRRWNWSLLCIIFPLSCPVCTSSALHCTDSLKHIAIQSNETCTEEATEAVWQMLQEVEACERQELHNTHVNYCRVGISSGRSTISHHHIITCVQLHENHQFPRLSNSKSLHSVSQLLPHPLVSCQFCALLRHESSISWDIQRHLLHETTQGER